ncbi:MAG TPA: hypothetical protein VFB72_09040 [Verrucomicrobiae bacterium]|nr:hypothetical protein [Verrucomicrobiae bacterium]
MFTAKDIKELMQAKPFTPFEIKMIDGSSYEVANHDAAFVSRNFIEVGTDLDADKIPGKVVRCSILHNTQIENLEAA